jgi:hypothetical protein
MAWKTTNRMMTISGHRIWQQLVRYWRFCSTKDAAKVRSARTRAARGANLECARLAEQRTKLRLEHGLLRSAVLLLIHGLALLLHRLALLHLRGLLLVLHADGDGTGGGVRHHGRDGVPARAKGDKNQGTRSATDLERSVGQLTLA